MGRAVGNVSASVLSSVLPFNASDSIVLSHFCCHFIFAMQFQVYLVLYSVKYRKCILNLCLFSVVMAEVYEKLKGALRLSGRGEGGVRSISSSRCTVVGRGYLRFTKRCLLLKDDAGAVSVRSVFTGCRRFHCCPTVG
ncbi:hypothetical protein Tcan_01152, partial [Toxocara canis]